MNYCKLALIVNFVIQATALGTVIEPNPIPIERLVKNTAAYIEENPKDSHGYYTMARIHYFALYNKTFKLSPWHTEQLKYKSIGSVRDDHVKERLLSIRAEELVLEQMNLTSKEEVTDWAIYHDLHRKQYEELRKENWQPPQLSSEQLIEHAHAALKYFTIAIDMDRNNALYHLGFACFLEQYIDFLKTTDSDVIPIELHSIILEKSKETFYKAYELSIKTDLKRKYLPGADSPTSLLGHETGTGYLRVLNALGSISPDDEKRAKAVKKNLKKLERLKMKKGIIVTPIIFSLKDQRSLSELLSENTEVEFDLDGDGVSEKWPWVKPDTGILVWDPQGSLKISSGRQLFGSVTWWMFFTDGYHAMDALDDNRDQYLTGDELDGISVWLDENTNGISDPGEVIPAKFYIEALSTKSDAKEDGCPISTKGLRLKNGKFHPTYDWLAIKP